MGKIKDINSIPTWETRAFGIEIEFIHKPAGGHRYNNREMAMAIKNKANELMLDDSNYISPIKIYGESYNHTTQEYWKIVNDVTVKPTARQIAEGFKGGYELVSPILKGQTSKMQLKYILKAMQLLNCDVSRNCGLHVHHDVRTWKNELNNPSTRKSSINKIVNVITLVTKFENIIYGMLPKSRKPGGSNNRWCRSINLMMHNVFKHINGKTSTSRKEKTDVANETINSDGRTSYHFQSDRYCGLNFQSFKKYGTIEFRYGAPTLDFDKLFNWVIFTQRFIISAELFKTVNASNEMKINTEHDIYITFIKVRDSLCLTRRMCKTPEELNASLWIRKRFNEHHIAA